MRPRDLRVAVVAVMFACAPAVPTTHIYRLQLPTGPGSEPATCEPATRGSLLVRDMQVAGAYDDARMVYRESEYRLQRYEYHEWVAPPGELVSDALRDGYAASGWFARVDRERDASVAAALQGRVLELEEVDVTRTRWFAHLRLELELLDARTHERLWSHEYDVTHPMEERSPTGLAAATSAVLREVIDASAPELAAVISGPCARSEPQPKLQRVDHAKTYALHNLGDIVRRARRLRPLGASPAASDCDPRRPRPRACDPDGRRAHERPLHAGDSGARRDHPR